MATLTGCPSLPSQRRRKTAIKTTENEGGISKNAKDRRNIYLHPAKVKKTIKIINGGHLPYFRALIF